MLNRQGAQLSRLFLAVPSTLEREVGGGEGGVVPMPSKCQLMCDFFSDFPPLLYRYTSLPHLETNTASSEQVTAKRLWAAGAKLSGMRVGELRERNAAQVIQRAFHVGIESEREA